MNESSVRKKYVRTWRARTTSASAIPAHATTSGIAGGRAGAEAAGAPGRVFGRGADLVTVGRTGTRAYHAARFVLAPPAAGSYLSGAHFGRTSSWRNHGSHRPNDPTDRPDARRPRVPRRSGARFRRTRIRQLPARAEGLRFGLGSDRQAARDWRR